MAQSEITKWRGETFNFFLKKSNDKLSANALLIVLKTSHQNILKGKIFCTQIYAKALSLSHARRRIFFQSSRSEILNIRLS